jgi:acetyl-CoA carboxylase biotin carboxyl carrier protein
VYPINELKELLHSVHDLSITELEIEKDGTKITIRKPEPPYISPYHPLYAIASTAPSVAHIPATLEVNGEEVTVSQPEAAKPEISVIKSTFVGSFKPKAKLEEGQVVTEGDVLGYVVSFDIPNEIRANRSGTIAAVHISEGELVEYGHELFEVNHV